MAAGGVGKLRGVHGAELRAAHGAELGFLVEIVGQGLVVHGAGGIGIEGKVELLVPVKEETGVAERVVAVARAGTMAGDVSGMRSNFVGDDSLLDVFGIGQAKMLFWC